MGVTFGGVVVHSHARIIDGSKLPSDGLVPLGLGKLIHTEEHSSIEAFDEDARLIKQHRAESDGLILWFHIPPPVRIELLPEDESENGALLIEVERENAEILRAKSESLSDTASLFKREGDDMGSGEEGHQAGLKRPSANADLPPQYSTASAGEKRTGIAGGFCEVALEEEATRRRERAAEDQRRKLARKAERAKCKGCHRYACIC